jgi:acetyl esterase/lipase
MVVAWLYLLFSLSWLYGALNALWPVRSSRWLVVSSWLFGWLVGEAPLLWLLGEASIAALFISEGALRRRVGLFALALSLIAWALLVYLYRQGSAAARVLDEALTSALEPELRGSLRPGSAPPADPRGRLLVPWWYRHSGVRRIRDVAYGDGGRRHLLDVYLPRTDVQDAPVLLQIHGGAWSFGHKAQQAQPLLYGMAAQGWVAVSINYALSPWQRWPAQLLDAKRALIWVKRNIARYGGDPRFIVCTGGSAGGQLAALLALTPNETRFQPHDPQVDTRVQAAVPLYAVYDLCDSERLHRHGGLRMLLEWLVVGKRYRDHEALYRDASPLAHVRADAPPFFVIHGTHDSLVPVEEARLFVQRLRAVSQSVVGYAELPLAQHAFEVFHSPRTGHAVRAVHAFCEAMYAAHMRAHLQTQPRANDGPPRPMAE